MPSPVALTIDAAPVRRSVEPNCTTAPGVGEPVAGTVTAVDPPSSMTPASNAWTAGPVLSLIVASPWTWMSPPRNAKIPPLNPALPLLEILLVVTGPNAPSPTKTWPPEPTKMPVHGLFEITLPPASVADPWKTWMPKRPNGPVAAVPLLSIVVLPMKAAPPMAMWIPTEPLLLTVIGPAALPFWIPIRALPALEIMIPGRAFDMIVLKTIVAFPPSMAMPFDKPFWIVTPPVRLLTPSPIWPLLPRPTKRFEPRLLSTTPPTTLPAELSLMAMPLPPFPLTVTGFTLVVPTRSWPTRRCELRTAKMPVAVLPLTVLFVITTDAVFEAPTPFPVFGPTVQESTETVLPWEATTPFIELPRTVQLLRSSVEPRNA